MRLTTFRAISATEPGPVSLPRPSSADRADPGPLPGLRTVVRTLIWASPRVGKIICYYP